MSADPEEACPMPTPRSLNRRLPAGALWVLAIGSLVGVSTMPGSSSATTGSAPGANTAPGADPHATATVSITGKVTGLYPGATLPLVLSLTNHDTVMVTVTSVTTAVANASTTCVAANVKVTAFSGSLVLAAGKTGKVTVHAVMAHTAPNACQGKVFPFTYTGSATAG